MRSVNVMVFDNFETLDACGPVEIFGAMSDAYELGYYSQSGGMISSRQGLRIATQDCEHIAPGGILLIPGGMGTRPLVSNREFLEQLAAVARESEDILTVCTGSALLAMTGLLNARHATSNKLAFDWVTSLNSSVLWEPQARWVKDGNIFSSSGVSAGMDMALGYISEKNGSTTAHTIAHDIEYLWNEDPHRDPFAVAPHHA